jgi:surface antigen
MHRMVAIFLAAGALVMPGAPAFADDVEGLSRASRPDTGELPPYLECVPYARQVSGIQIYGDAYTWWDQAEGRYARGSEPRVGAVMAFQPHGTMKLGHVAAISKVVDSRTVLLRHANWSPIEGRRGQIEDDVRAVDVSPANDWSEVRVWYGPLGDLGTTVWPVQGFIYPSRGGSTSFQVAAAPEPVAPSRDFLKAFASLDGAVSAARPLSAQEPKAMQPVDLIAQVVRRR